jgi:hypothetical protein
MDAMGEAYVAEKGYLGNNRYDTFNRLFARN